MEAEQYKSNIELLESISDRYKNILVLKDDKITQRSVIPLGVVTKELNRIRALLQKAKNKI